VFVLRCTRKLLERVDASSRHEIEPPKSTTLLGDWTANLVIIRRQHLVLSANNSTLLPVVLLAAPYRTLLPRFIEAVGQVLAGLEIEPTKIRMETNAMSEGVVARTNDRRILGSLNDFANLLDAYLDGRPLTEVALHMADAPCSPLGMGRPLDAARERFSRPVLRLVKV
jgi:hypothetical protein